MANKGDDLYGTMGSVPDQVSVNGTGAGMLSAKATPEAFGSGVGAAVANAGSQAQDIVQKLQGMQNETLATNADASLAEKIGAIKGQYKSLSGQEAVNARQPTIDAMNKAFQETRASLPPMAAQGFDSMAKRSLGYSLGEVNEYWASNVKLANTNAHARTISDAALSPKIDPTVANNDELFNHKLGDIQWAAGSMMDPDHPGFDKDTKTGVIKGYKDNIAGQTLKSTYQNTLNGYTGEAWKNRFDALASQDPIAANDKFNLEKDRIPPLAAVDIQAKLEPQVTYAQANQTSQFSIVKAQQDHEQALLNPPSNGPNPFNLGNVKTKAGAANNTAEFLNPATPLDGVITTANTLRSGYNGMSLSEIGPKWTGEPQKAAEWVSNAASSSGLDPNSKLNLSDPATLNSLLKGVAVAEKSPKDRAAFTDEIISQGVDASLSGKQAAMSTQQNKPYYTNPDGSKVTQADYLSMNREQILSNLAAESERQFPGDLKTAQMARELTIQRMDAIIKDQKDNYAQDNKQVIKNIFSDNPPATLDDLYKQKGMSDVLNRVAAQDPKFFTEAIPKLIEQGQKGNTLTNSPNFIHTALRVLEPNNNEHPNRIRSEYELDKLLGNNTGNSINMKDHKDAAPAIEYPENIKRELTKQIKIIINANGNVDGKGEDRAGMFFNYATKIIAKNYSQGDKAKTDSDIISRLREDSLSMMPSRSQQLGQAASVQENPEKKPSPERIMIMNAYGKKFTIPVGQLDEAVKSGYKKVE